MGRMNKLEQLLKEATDKLRNVQQQLENGEALEEHQGKQRLSDEMNRKQQEIEQIKEYYNLINHVAAQLDPTMQIIFTYANENQIFRGRSVNIPSQRIRRPILKELSRDMGHTMIDYHRFAEKDSSFPRPLQEFQVIDFARRLTFMPNLPIALQENDHYIQWTSTIEWPLYHYFSGRSGGERSPIFVTAGPAIIMEGFTLEINAQGISIEQTWDNIKFTEKERVFIKHPIDVEVVNVSLMDAFVGNLNKKQINAEI
jgi:hypothetical protein